MPRPRWALPDARFVAFRVPCPSPHVRNDILDSLGAPRKAEQITVEELEKWKETLAEEDVNDLAKPHIVAELALSVHCPEEAICA